MPGPKPVAFTLQTSLTRLGGYSCVPLSKYSSSYQGNLLTNASRSTVVSYPIVSTSAIQTDTSTDITNKLTNVGNCFPQYTANGSPNHWACNTGQTFSVDCSSIRSLQTTAGQTLQPMVDCCAGNDDCTTYTDSSGSSRNNGFCTIINAGSSGLAAMTQQQWIYLYDELGCHDSISLTYSTPASAATLLHPQPSPHCKMFDSHTLCLLPFAGDRLR